MQFIRLGLSLQRKIKEIHVNCKQILISEPRQQQNGIIEMHLQSQPQDTKFRQRHHMKRQQHLRQQRDQQQQRRRPQPQQDQLHQVHVGLNAN